MTEDPLIVAFRYRLSEWFEELATYITNLPLTTNCSYTETHRVIGHGSYGSVVIAKRPTDNEFVVIKRFTRPLRVNGLSTVREICFLSQLNHGNIVSILDICLRNGSGANPEIKLVLELCRCDLQDFIYKTNYTEDHSKVIITQICRGLSYIHRCRIIHRDLKPQNILIGFDGKLKIADFGLSRLKRRRATKTYTPHIGTRGYQAPEIFLGSVTYDEKVDIFSLGVIIITLYTKAQIFAASKNIVT
ncbi:unnamed protein product [Rodentolepis nana]|uniref:Protein kinase domain-containing protein n=1 Tax=Rodentolepis nana TaxID=102285 RepID=A0A0R3T3P0_RODNA|nr:unnamed protein product [Rodentolepis nana]